MFQRATLSDKKLDTKIRQCIKFNKFEQVFWFDSPIRLKLNFEKNLYAGVKCYYRLDNISVSNLLFLLHWYNILILDVFFSNLLNGSDKYITEKYCVRSDAN